MTSLITRALPLLNKLIPAGLAVKGLSKINPKLSSFVTNALGAGYGAENIVDYLRDRMSSEGDKMESKRLEKGESSGSLNSQEQVALAKRRQENGLGKAIGAGVGIAAGIGGLGGQQEEVQEPQQNQTISAQKNQPPIFKQPVSPPPIPPEKKRLGTLNKFNQQIKKKSLREQELDRFNSHYGQEGIQQDQTQNIDQELLRAIAEILNK